MMPSRRQNTVPLHIWAKAFFIACVVFCGGYGLFALHDEDRVFFQYRSNLVPGMSQTEAYILGSSLAEKGLHAFGSLDSALVHNRLRFNYTLIFRSGAVIRDFSPILGEIKKTRPRYVLIESNILCIDLSPLEFGPFISSVASYRNHLLKILKRFATQWIKSIFPLSREPAETNAFNKNTPIDENYWISYGKLAKKFRVRKIDDFPEWNDFFRKARESGTKVVLLEFPRSREATRYVPKTFLEEQEKLITRFEEQYHVIHMKFPLEMERRTYFADAAHLNQEGAKVFSEWLADRLQKDTEELDH